LTGELTVFRPATIFPRGAPRDLFLMIINRQRRVPVRVRDLEAFLSRARRVLRLPAGGLTVCFVTNSEMARWNGDYRGKRRATDVLSFPSNELSAKKKGLGARQNSRGSVPTSLVHGATYLGDIAIAPALALHNASRFGRTLESELRILIVHGILHLMGYDHETDNGEMERRELRIRRALELA
jgi:probable rRNA maturation factor